MITKLYPVADLAINLAVGDESRSLNLDRNYVSAGTTEFVYKYKIERLSLIS